MRSPVLVALLCLGCVAGLDISGLSRSLFFIGKFRSSDVAAIAVTALQYAEHLVAEDKEVASSRSLLPSKIFFSRQRQWLYSLPKSQ